jgi:antitoxin VapB
MRYINPGGKMEPSDRARVFWSGRSQAVRLPKGYRFEGEEVRIRKFGAPVILEPIPKDWRWLDELHEFGALDADVVEAAREDAQPQHRPRLDGLFD